jgi:hypothetical protein
MTNESTAPSGPSGAMDQEPSKAVYDGSHTPESGRTTECREAGEWLARAMFCIDWWTEEMPPPPVWAAFIDAAHRDDSGVWHNGELSREDVDCWLREEAGYPPPAPEKAERENA